MSFKGAINGKLKFFDDYVEKHFPVESSLDRYSREKFFYRYCLKLNLGSVPQLKEFDDDKRIIKIQRLEARKIIKFNKFYLFSFIELIKKININNNFDNILIATEASFSDSDIRNHIEQRLARFKNENAVSEAISIFKYFTNQLRSIQPLKLNFGDSMLNPSDNGIHNSLRGKICYFIDFEYSGRDSFTKLFYDFILHPANSICHSNFAEIYHSFKEQIPKFDVQWRPDLLRLFALWWIIRLLNSVGEKTIEQRRSMGTLKDSQVDPYIKQRLEAAKKFTGMLDNA